ncbi:hypothetical protein [Terrimonas pollutisoli]|uniref:hypothetical protein n=1 Tax=Terrimonas pollutisoli TaxID=3034147 RepID=UPI0023EAE529|nr:hypothetical protein [Terrimonas sp. H1YJ31]
MASYLLLRDNKESGPFSVEDLRKAGLKPYDLIWVEGRSAAWRYPCEIEELKPFAPVVEEQPFDRFFKRNEPESEPKAEIKEEPPVKEEYLKYAPIEKKEEPAFSPKRSVFVTLPNQKQVVTERPVVAERPAKKEPQKEMTPPPVISITETAPVAEIKYSQPLDEIKEMYVKTLQDRRSRMAKKTIWLGWAKKAGVVVGLIVVGVLAGLAIRSNNGKEDKVTNEMVKTNTAVTHTALSQPAEEQPGTQNEPANELSPATVIKKNEEGVANYNQPGNTGEEKTTLRIRKETMLIVPKQKPVFDNRQTPPSSGVDEITGERSRKLRIADENIAAVTEEKSAQVKTNKTSLRDQVSVSSNDYKIVAFGGIRNLYLTVTNNSKYELDHVIVELQYLKPSEEPLRTENINFKSIAANSSATIRIPDTNRGIKVSYKIINIDSKQSAGDVAGRY